MFIFHKTNMFESNVISHFPAFNGQGRQCALLLVKLLKSLDNGSQCARLVLFTSYPVPHLLCVSHSGIPVLPDCFSRSLPDFFHLAASLKYIGNFFRVTKVKEKISCGIKPVLIFDFKHFLQNFFVHAKNAIFPMPVIAIPAEVHCPDKYFLVIVDANNFRMKFLTALLVGALKMQALSFFHWQGKIIVTRLKNINITFKLTAIGFFYSVFTHETTSFW